MSRILISLLVFIFIIGCSSKEVKPYELYSLSDTTKVDVPLHVNKVLKVTKIKSPVYLQNEKIWYKNSSVEIDSYFYSKWNGSFTAMLEQNLVNSISRSKLFKATYVRYSKVRADLSFEIEMIEAIQDIQKQSVLFGIRVYLIDQKNSKLIDANEFNYEEKCLSIDAKGAVEAHEKIIKKLNKDVILWLSKSVKEN